MRRNLDQLQQDMPHDYCHRIDCQGLGDRDLSELAHQPSKHTGDVAGEPYDGTDSDIILVVQNKVQHRLICNFRI